MPDPEVPARGSRTYSAAYKAKILDEYESLDKAGKGALLRREGLYTSLISAWRQQRDAGARAALGKTVSQVEMLVSPVWQVRTAAITAKAWKCRVCVRSGGPVDDGRPARPRCAR